MSAPHLDLPAYARQDGYTVYVSTIGQAMEVVDWIPEELDSQFGIIIEDWREHRKLKRLGKAFGIKV